MASSPNKRMKVEDGVQVADNLIDGEFVGPISKEYVDVISPVTGEVIGSCAVSTSQDVDVAVAKGQEAFKEWSKLTVKSRTAIMLKFHALMNEHADELADIVVKENGKNKMEALASVLKAGVPKGVFQTINGKAEAVTSLCDHPKVAAVTFVGSSHVAQLVARRCRAQDKRVLALGGAKNHLVALPDADNEMAAKDIVASYAGCAGQRCMAASVLLLVGECDELLNLIVEKSKQLKRGTEAGQVGAVIDHVSKDRILKYINEAEQSGVKVLVDGRSWANEAKGSWVGPTVLLHTNPNDAAMKDEIFGPVLSIYKVKSFDEALEIENGNDYGNAASIYTSNGGYAEYFQSRFRAGMIGVNIGIPVPREPFSFGGMYGTKSKYGDMDITGDGCVEFFSNRRKITSKWSTVINAADKANFSGQI
uniref:methylmalonate-semialdehyde dehydrogenase (CoA acylating) n=1 Tax=Globisporangium ultimum (strain ATCC 200006 / CBS 805.95 / DAOM BR144) TaxID=431595 RepID=K3WXA9_GLOUD